MTKQYVTNIIHGKSRSDVIVIPNEKEKRNKNRAKYTNEQILEMAEIFKTSKRAAVLRGMEFGMSEPYAIHVLYGRARPDLIPPRQPKEETKEQEASEQSQVEGQPSD